MIDKVILDKTNAWPFVEAKKLLRERKSFIEKKGKIVLQTGYGPSGLPHIGTFAEVARTSMIVNALNNLKIQPSSMIDISDGLIGDMNKLINNQNLSYEIYLDQIPISVNLKTLLKKTNKKKVNYLFHGDDYQILFTAHKKSRKSIKKFSKIMNQKITIIGKINSNSKKSVLLTSNNRKILTNFDVYFHKF